MLRGLRARAASAFREGFTGRALVRLRDLTESAASIVSFPMARTRRHGSGVLLYHGVVPVLKDPFVEAAHIEAGLFRRQIRHLVRHYRVVSLGEVIERLVEGRPLPDDWVALTFDDGYRNNLSCARQILHEEGGLPMSVFVVTDFVGTNRTIPTVLLKMCTMYTRASRVRMPMADGSWKEFALGSRHDRANAYWAGYAGLRSLDAARQMLVLEEFLAQLGGGEAEEIRERFPSYDWLDWDQVRELDRDGVEVGSHTCSHPSMRSELGEQRLRLEIEGSRRRIREEVGRVSDTFVYPYGTAADMGDLTVEVLRSDGIRAALTTVPGTVRAGDDPYRLKRLAGCVGTMGRFRRANATGMA